MKLLKITSLLFFLLGFSAQSQVSVRQESGFSIGLPQGEWNDSAGLLINSASMKLTSENVDEFEGHPFLDEDFRLGKALFGDKRLENVPLRYNVVFEDMEINMDGEVMVINNKDAIVFINGKKYVFMDYQRDGKNLSGYFQVIVEPKEETGGATLLLKHYKVLRDGGPMRIGDTSPPKDELDNESAYYISINGGLTKIERNQDDFLTIFPQGKRGQIEKYMDEERLKLRKEEDLVEVIDHYNRSI